MLFLLLGLLDISYIVSGDDFSAVTEKQAKIGSITLIPLGENGIFFPNETIKFSLNIKNHEQKKHDISAKITVKDYYNASVYEKIMRIELSGDSVSNIITVPPPEKLGFYGIDIVIGARGEVVSEKSSFCILPHLKNNDPFWGIASGLPPGPLSKAIRIMGAKSIQLHIPWKIEKEEGIYDFSKVDELLNEYSVLGFESIASILIIPNHSSIPEWIRKGIGKREKSEKGFFEPDYFKKFSQFVKVAVTRYKSMIKTWTFTQEIDSAIDNPGQCRHYIEMIKSGYNAAKEVNPHCIIESIGVSGCDGTANPPFPVARKLLPELSAYLDGMSYDSYMNARRFGPEEEPTSPENGNYRNIIMTAQKLAEQYTKGRLGIDEMGYCILHKLPTDSIYAKEMAKFLARILIISKSIQRLERLHWFLAYSNVTDPNSPEDYGLWKRHWNKRESSYPLGTFEPRPTVAAYAATSRFLSGASDAIEIKPHNDIFSYIFKKDKGSVGAIWTISNESVPFCINVPKVISLCNLMGNMERELLPGKNELLLSGSPYFLLSSDLSSKQLAAIIAKGTFSLPMIKTDMRLENSEVLTLYLANQTIENINVRVVMNNAENIHFFSQEIDIKVPAREIIPIKFNIKEINIDSKTDFMFSGDIFIGNNVYHIKKTICLFPVHYIDKTIIDGNLDEYQNLPPIVFDNEQFLYPSDAYFDGRWNGVKDLSIKAWTAWDEKNFYFAASVLDDKFVQEKTGSEIWANDSIQLAFDTLNNALKQEINGAGYDNDDYEYGIALTNSGAQCFCWTAGEKEKLINKLLKLPLVVKRINDTTTNYELAIPWQYLSPLKVVPGTIFGFNFAVFDTDISQTISSYWMRLSSGIAPDKNPSIFNSFILQPNLNWQIEKREKGNDYFKKNN